MRCNPTKRWNWTSELCGKLRLGITSYMAWQRKSVPIRREIETATSNVLVAVE
jgi:hypothetical protein